MPTRRNQEVWGEARNSVLRLPGETVEVLPGVVWGRPDYLFTPAYWAAQAFHHAAELDTAPIRVGETLLEEVVACLLGGHGASSEIGLAAFNALRAAKLLDASNCSEAKVRSVLSAPLALGRRAARYRFANRRAHFVATVVATLDECSIPKGSHIEFRDYLTTLKGIGLKTASWITRNWLDSDQVAVLDVHLLRAGSLMGLFPPELRVDRDYRVLEHRFLSFARAIGIRVSRLDALIWRQMKTAGDLALHATKEFLNVTSRDNMLSHAA